MTIPMIPAAPTGGGNFLTDLGQAGSSIATGFLAEKERQRKAAIDDAMRKLHEKEVDQHIEDMRQAARNTEFTQSHTLRQEVADAEKTRQAPILAQLDDARSKGIDINPTEALAPNADVSGAMGHARELQQQATKTGSPMQLSAASETGPTIHASVSPYHDPQEVRQEIAGKNYDLRAAGLQDRRYAQVKNQYEKDTKIPKEAMAAYQRVNAELGSGSSLNTSTALAALAQLAVPGNAREVNTVLRSINESGIFGGGFTSLEQFKLKANHILTGQGTVLTPEVAGEIKRAADALMKYHKLTHDAAIAKGIQYGTHRLGVEVIPDADLDSPEEYQMWQNLDTGSQTYGPKPNVLPGQLDQEVPVPPRFAP